MSHEAFGFSTSMPFMYGTSAFGSVMDPSAFWWFSRSGIRMRGLAIAVLFSV